MLYTDFSISLPNDSRYELHKQKHAQTYVKYRIKSYRVDGKLKHERLLIGKISNEDIDEIKNFHPKENYYLFLNPTS